MPNPDGPSLIAPAEWADLYLDGGDIDADRLRAILSRDQRLAASGFHAFVERERNSIESLSLYSFGALVISCRSTFVGMPFTQPFLAEPATITDLSNLFRDWSERPNGPITPIPSRTPDPDEEPTVPPSIALATGPGWRRDSRPDLGPPSRDIPQPNCIACGEPLTVAISPGEQPQVCFACQKNRALDDGRIEKSVPRPEDAALPMRAGLMGDALPEQIGDYRVLRQIGRGGMGMVYLGQHVHLDRLVAIKVLYGVMFNDPTAVDRLIREARIGAMLRHPNICQILDARNEGGEFYFVMEYVEGKSLSEMIRGNGPLPIERACNLAVQLFEALRYLGRRQVVHRDIKPANLIIGPGGQLKLLDLGLAKSVGADSQAMSEVTRTGNMMGTPGFMAPEQISDAKNVTPAADLYAAGTTLFEMLTGERPFTGGGVMDIIAKIAFERPPDPRELRPDLPPPLATLILRLLAKEPGNRPSADSALRVLRRWAGEPVAIDEEAMETGTGLLDDEDAIESAAPGGLVTSEWTAAEEAPSFVERIHRLGDEARERKASDADELLDLLRGPGGEPRLGEYTLKERLGPPSAISTYRAEMPYSGVRCVIRVFPPAFGQIAPERLAGLLREQGLLMRISTRSSHLSGLTFLGRAELNRGALRTVYYTVESFHEGQSLEERIRARETLGIREARLALLQAVSALGALHDEQIIHGNVHPAKILIDPERRDLCIVDLSRARRIGEEEREDAASLTLGGLNQIDWRHQDSYRRRQYLAPEILCDQRPHSLASEQYALSITIIEALTGEFIRTDENDLKLVNLVRAELEDRLDEIAEDAPRFAQVLRKMVKPKAESRYDDLRDVREALASGTKSRRSARRPPDKEPAHAPGPYGAPPGPRNDSPGARNLGKGQGGFDIFLSYRREGGAYASRAIFESLERRGYRVFLDIDRLKAGRFDVKLLFHIQNAPNFIVILSEGSLDRCGDRDDWLRREIAHAIQSRCKILPIMMPGFEMPRPFQLPQNLRKLPTFNAISYEHEHHDGVLDQIQQFIKSR